MKTEKEIRKQKMWAAYVLSKHLFETDGNIDPNKHHITVVFAFATHYTANQILEMTECDSIGKRVKQQFTEHFQELSKSGWNDYLESGDESNFGPTMVAYAVMLNDIEALLNQQEAE